MFSISVLLLLAAGSCVKCEQLTQLASLTVQPGQTLTLNCLVSYSVTSYGTHWIRQPAGKALEWMGVVWSGGSNDYATNVQGRIGITRDITKNFVYLTLSTMKPEESAVYYCARYAYGAFDYWGKGTEVTVSPEAPAAPSLFLVTQCDPGSGDTITLGCLAQDFFPKSATFQWTSTSNTQVDSQQYIFPQQNVNNRFTGVSVISVSKSNALSYTCSLTHPAGNKTVPEKYAPSPPNVTLLSESDGEKQFLVCYIENFTPKKVSFSWKKSNNDVSNFKSFDPVKDGDAYIAASILEVNKIEWDSKAVYTCEVTHEGQNYAKKASKASFTVTLNPPNPKKMFDNKKAELKCIITGLDGATVSKSNTKIQWYINGQPVANNNEAQSESNTLIRSFDEWKKVKNVQCVATRDDMAPITESLDVNRGNAIPDVQVLKLSNNTNEVTLVCLVTSSVLQDYYITWLEASGTKSGTYIDGINLPPQKINNSLYLVSSFYTISKNNWESTNKFSCNVWPANGKMKPHEVSSVSDFPSDSNMTIALSCIDNLSEGDDFNGLWSTTSSFVFLFIFSLTYNMIFILVQMKK